LIIIFLFINADYVKRFFLKIENMNSFIQRDNFLLEPNTLLFVRLFVSVKNEGRENSITQFYAYVKNLVLMTLASRGGLSILEFN
jgi:hypothetical protein